MLMMMILSTKKQKMFQNWRNYHSQFTRAEHIAAPNKNEAGQTASTLIPFQIELIQVHLACLTQFGDHGWMAALGYTDRYWAILDRSGLYEIELDYTDNSAKFASFRPQNLPQQGLSIPRPSRLPLGFALGQSLGPRDAKSLLRQISWYSGYTLLSCIRLY